jgi:hypothetical protein
MRAALSFHSEASLLEPATRQDTMQAYLLDTLRERSARLARDLKDGLAITLAGRGHQFCQHKGKAGHTTPYGGAHAVKAGWKAKFIPLLLLAAGAESLTLAPPIPPTRRACSVGGFRRRSP